MSPPKSKVRPHLFVVDPDVPARLDRDGRVVSPGCCATCHLPGEANDKRHTLPDVPAQAEHLRRYEGGDG